MKLTQRLTALFLCAALLFSLSGCRYSEVLEQIIYDMLRGRETNLDTDFKPEENDPENEETSDDLKDLSVDDEAEHITDETPDLPLTEEDPVELEEPDDPPDTSAAQTEFYEGGQDWSAGVVPEPVEGEDGSSEVLPGEDAPEEEEPLPEGGEESGAGEDAPLYEPDAGAETYKQVVDAYGKMVDIPENVDTVAAVGDLAVMVMILDSPERLSAVNANLNQGMASQVFPGLDQVPAIWSGNGGAALSDDGFQALLETAPDVVLETSGSAALTNSQAAALAEAGIAYLVLPQPTSTTNIQTIMTTLGTVLGDKSAEGGVNAPQRAADYVSWVDSVSQKVSQATAAYAGYSDESGASVNSVYTLYVDGWDDEAYFRVYNENYVTLSGYGCAYIHNGGIVSCKAISNFLKVAHVVNVSAQYGVAPKTQYFTPLVSSDHYIEVSGPAASSMSTDPLLEPGDGSLGKENFPILIAADSHTAQAIAQSEQWVVYPHINNGDGSFNSDGFLDEEGKLVRTQISGEYEIVVNPSGLSSWTGGSAESILESVWAAWRFFGALSEDEMRGYVSDFYSQFYGYSLSESDIDRILEGK